MILLLFRVLFRDRSWLALENLALRQQLAILHHKAPRPRLRRADRAFWLTLARVWDQWRSALIVVRPETVLRWHRQGFRYFWRWKSRGRPRVSSEVIQLIRRMSQENPLWGAPHIHLELLLLGHDVAEATVAKYMTRRGRRPPSQTWRTFLRNHLRTTAACDFFVVPTATFRLLFCFVILSHDRRRILDFNVTAPWDRRILFQGEVGPGLVVVANVGPPRQARGCKRACNNPAKADRTSTKIKAQSAVTMRARGSPLGAIKA